MHKTKNSILSAAETNYCAWFLIIVSWPFCCDLWWVLTDTSKSHSVTANVNKMSGSVYCSEQTPRGGADIFHKAPLAWLTIRDLHFGGGGTQSQQGMRGESGWAWRSLSPPWSWGGWCYCGETENYTISVVHLRHYSWMNLVKVWHEVPARPTHCSKESFNKGRHLVTIKYISRKASYIHTKVEKLNYLWKDIIEARFL